MLFLGLMVCFGFISLDKEEMGWLIIKINNVFKDKGIIWIGLYDFVDIYLIKEKLIFKKIDVLKKGYYEMVIDSFFYGIYVMVLFYDVNVNGEMDCNLLGIFLEFYVFLKKLKFKWCLLKFDEVKFDFL